MKRRVFLKLVPGAIGSAVGASWTGAPGFSAASALDAPIRLGMDCYTIRAFKWKAIELLDYAASQQMDAIQTNLVDLESTEDAYLKQVKEHADRVGVAIEPGMQSICPLSRMWNPGRQGNVTDYLLMGLRLAKAFDAKAVKCYLGNSSDRFGEKPIAQLIDATIKSLRTVQSRATDSGIKFAIENHGDLLASEVKTIIEEAGKDYVGCCLDTGNPVTLAEDPMQTLEVLGPYTITTHVRDAAVFQHPRGASYQFVGLGEGSINFQSFMARFRVLCPNAPILLEILTGMPPEVVPFLETDFGERFPGRPAADLARFAALAKSGHPFQGKMVVAQGKDRSADLAAALKNQQRDDLQRSLDYARTVLDLGVRWRK